MVIDGAAHPLDRDGDGYFAGVVASARAGSLYRFRLDDERDTYPDPASRFQPEGPHGPSMVVDPSRYRWHDAAWRGVSSKGTVLYEMHIGTYTAEGTWSAAIEHLGELREIGITAIEVMPVNEFAGRFGWGYDGVAIWAPFHHYGTPDDFRAFVDAAHATGLGVILDVVYNHFGPDGCYLAKFSDSWFTERANEWGQQVNFDDDGVRAFVSENAGYWIEEFHLDGLRIDATQSIADDRPMHIVCLVTQRAREAAGERTIYVAAENEPQRVEMIARDGLDAMWNDDWHHSAMVAATGRREAYYTDYFGRPQEFISMAKHGFLYQGQHYRWQKNRRGTPALRLPPEQLVCYLQNHDQIANSASGRRLHQLTTPGRFRALTALLLLGPNTPLLFQGEELGSPAPFLYFADHKPELAKEVSKGRREFLSQFPSIAAVKDLAPPEDEATFTVCKLDHDAYDEKVLALHRDLLRLRRDRAFATLVDGAVLGDEAFVLRYEQRLLIINLGRDQELSIVPEPLLAPPEGKSSWTLLWSSESEKYGGGGTAAVEREDGWRIPGHAAVVMGTED